jgi:hypothetical protein
MRVIASRRSGSITRVGVAELVRREAAPDPRAGGEPPELRADGRD